MDQLPILKQGYVLTGIGVVPCQGKEYRKETLDRLARKIFNRELSGRAIPWALLNGKVQLFAEWGKAEDGV